MAVARGAGDADELSVPVLVLGVGLSALGVVRCLGRAGLRPYLVSRPGDLAELSRWSRKRLVHMVEPVSPLDMVPLLDRLDLQRAVLIPCTDVWAQVVAQLPEDAYPRFATSSPSAGVIDLLVDKLLFAETLERLDVPRPRTVSVESEADLDRPLDGFFLKPRQSQLFAQRYHRKALVFDGRDEARAALSLITDVGLTAVLQEYIPGPPTCHYFIDGFMTGDGSVAALFARRRIRMFPLDFGNSTLMVSVPLGDVRPAADDLVRLLAGIGYRGVFSAEFKIDPRDGVFKILEVNSRPWWYIEFASQCGVDVCLMAYRDALGLDLPKLGPYAVGKRCVFLPQDTQAFRALRSANELSLLGWLRSWIGARSTIFAWSDPLPALLLPIVFLRRRRRLASPL